MTTTDGARGDHGDPPRTTRERFAALTPILDRTCWYCGGEFETRDPDAGLCPRCEGLRDEDTRRRMP
jgi:hypothetical protein